MIKILFRFIVLFILNFAVLFYSSNANVYQLFLDLEKISLIKEFNETILYILISLSVPILCMSLLFFFRLFILFHLHHINIQFNAPILQNWTKITIIFLIQHIKNVRRLNLSYHFFLLS